MGFTQEVLLTFKRFRTSLPNHVPNDAIMAVVDCCLERVRTFFDNEVDMLLSDDYYIYFEDRSEHGDTSLINFRSKDTHLFTWWVFDAETGNLLHT